MKNCYDGVLAMPQSYAVMDEEEMTYLNGGKSYYNTAAILANTCQVSGDMFIGEAALLASLNPGAGAITAAMCTHNATMYFEAKAKCENYSDNTYITLTINYSNPFWISSVSVKKGK